jgi:hypothetical protein
MDRLVVLWTRPHHLSDEEAQWWALGEARRLLSIPSVRGTRLTSLAAASPRWARPWDWMLEVRLADSSEAADCADDPICTDWLHDLHVLGTRPTMVFARGGIAFGEAEN